MMDKLRNSRTKMKKAVRLRGESENYES